MTAEVIEKGILLTFDEIRILLYGMGVSEIDGVYMPEKAFTEEEILSAMQHLSASGLIEAGDEKCPGAYGLHSGGNEAADQRKILLYEGDQRGNEL